MSEQTNIEWCDSTFNPWIGCTKVSPGCDHCYAERSTPVRTMKVLWGASADRQRTSAANWRQPLLWEKEHEAFKLMHGRRRRVFCASLADVFDNEVDPHWRADFFALIQATPNLDWVLLTKRIGNVVGMVPVRWLSDPGWPANVLLGATVVNQAEADRDIPKLLAVPARVRFLSIEPMLGPIDLTLDGLVCLPCPWCVDRSSDPETGAVENCRRCEWSGKSNEWGIDWVIAGGESGPKARPSHPDWFRSLRDQCEADGVPFLFKQWGEWAEAWGSGTHLVYEDGRVLEGTHDHPDAWKHKTAEMMRRVGKKAAGRLLDGCLHDGYPKVRA